MLDKIFLWNLLLFFGTILTAGFCLFDNTISSVFSCIFIYLISTILLLMINVEFISLLIVIIYIGAVAILFLFVTFMLGGDPVDKSIQKKFKVKQSIIFIAIIKISLLVDFLDILSDHINIIKRVDTTNLYHLYLYSTGDIHIFNTLLYGRFGSLVIFIAFILFLVLLAAISLVKNKAK